jgi:hypothetical protein
MSKPPNPRLLRTRSVPLRALLTFETLGGYQRCRGEK